MIEKIILYEIRRAIARKKVITLVAITFLFEIGIYLSLAEFRTPRVEELLKPIEDLIWLAGVLLPQSLLIHFISISISSGSMSEEYEQGTVDFFMTKPITRLQFLLGKFIGGYLLVSAIYGLMVLLALVFSESFFGYQAELNYLGIVVLSILFSTLTFFSIGFMFGEMLRRSSLAFLVSSTILIGSVIIGAVLLFVAKLTGLLFLIGIAISLPSWGATELPFLLAQAIPNASLIVQALEIFPAVPGTTIAAIAYILGYSSISIAIGFLSYLHRDIPKKVS
ncbi:ABC transporter permease [Acidianus sulfidivorans]|uniref:ABC transporter permease n=1 Tax=Acidianus sulfidivorans TaxID=312539 RepID=UPI0026CD8D8C